MWAWFRGLAKPPAFEGDEQKTRTALLLHNILVVVTLSAALTTALVAWVGENAVPALLAGGATVALVGLLVLLRLGFVWLVSVLMPLSLWVAFTVGIYSFNGIRDGAVAGYFLVVILASLAPGSFVLYAFVLLSVLSLTGAYLAELNGIIATAQAVASPPGLADLVILAMSVAVSAFLLRYIVGGISVGYERARRAAQALRESNRELERNRDALERQADDLGRWARYMQTTAEVARDAGSILNLRELLIRVVNLISERFGVYHAGLFLVDPSSQWAVLQAASSKGGQRMLDRGHRLRVGEQGIVGYVAGQGEHRVALDVGEDAVFFDNPDLPETRSEMALPLRARGEIIGVLDVQSTEPQAFGKEDVGALQTLADQVAVAIDNARLFQQAQESLEAERRAYGELGREAWRELLGAQPDLGFLSDAQGTVPAGDLWEPQMEAALRAGETMLGDGGMATLAIPIVVRDQVVGVVDGRKPDGTPWTRQEIDLMEAMTRELDVALEGARLYRDARRREARERAIGQIAGRIRESLELKDILRTAAGELRRALGLGKVVVRLAMAGEGPAAQVDGKRSGVHAALGTEAGDA